MLQELGNGTSQQAVLSVELAVVSLLVVCLYTRVSMEGV